MTYETKQAICIFGIIIFLLIIGVSAYKIITIRGAYQEAIDEYESLRDVTVSESTEDVPEEIVFSEDEKEDKLRIFHTELDYIIVPKVERDFPALQAINPDVCGWISIPGTHINYPVVRGTDNDYYLRRSVKNTPNNAGAIFLDYRCKRDFSDQNVIIYGHNQRNSHMFHDLLLYFNDTQYQAEHPYIYLLNADGSNYVYQFTGCYRVNNGGMLVQEDSEEQVVTLFTCTNENDENRIIVRGKRIQ